MPRVKLDAVERSIRRREQNARYYKNKKEREQGSRERSVLVQWRLPETMVGRIHRCVNEGLATGKYPWKTATDAVKDLIYRGFGTLRGDELIDEMWPALEMMKQLDYMEAQKREAQVMLNKSRSVIGELLAIKAYKPALQFFHVTWEAAEKMPATIWRDWLLKKLREAFPDLAKVQAPPARLVGRAPKKIAKKAANA